MKEKEAINCVKLNSKLRLIEVWRRFQQPFKSYHCDQFTNPCVSWLSHTWVFPSYLDIFPYRMFTHRFELITLGLTARVPFRLSYRGLDWTVMQSKQIQHMNIIDSLFYASHTLRTLCLDGGILGNPYIQNNDSITLIQSCNTSVEGNGRALVSWTKGLALKSRDERVLPLRSFHTTSSSTCKVSRKQTSSVFYIFCKACFPIDVW